MCRGFRSIRLPLTNYLHETIVRGTNGLPAKQEQDSDLWPCPLPDTKRDRNRASCPRRLTGASTTTSSMIVRLLVATLNWLVLGRRASIPADLRNTSDTAARPSKAQSRMQLHFLRVSKIWSRGGRSPTTGLSRQLVKYTELDQSLRELSAASQSIACHLLPYGASKSDTAPSGPEEDELASHIAPVLSVARDIEADKVSFSHPPSFDPLPHLKDPLLRGAYKQPSYMRKPTSMWPLPRRVHVKATREEMFKLFRK